ncbi:MAG: hypothetical protein OXG81_13825 [Acidobacteria bacterium]|nr:hypothetical protein [Acidobacteriota bacterium]
MRRFMMPELAVLIWLAAAAAEGQRHPYSVVRSVTTEYAAEFGTYSFGDVYAFRTRSDTSQVLVDLYWNVNAVWYVGLSVWCYNEAAGEFLQEASSVGTGHLTAIRAEVPAGHSLSRAGLLRVRRQTAFRLPDERERGRVDAAAACG